MNETCRYCTEPGPYHICQNCKEMLMEFLALSERMSNWRERVLEQARSAGVVWLPDGRVVSSEHCTGRLSSASSNLPTERVGPPLPNFPLCTASEFIKLCISGLRELAGMCDGARAKDNSGFSKSDVEFGTGMAQQEFLSQKQQPLAAKLIIKYRRQLSPQLVEAVQKFAASKGWV